MSPLAERILTECMDREYGCGPTRVSDDLGVPKDVARAAIWELWEGGYVQLCHLFYEDGRAAGRGYLTTIKGDTYKREAGAAS